jgi:hypothetical protein
VVPMLDFCFGCWTIARCSGLRVDCLPMISY